MATNIPAVSAIPQKSQGQNSDLLKRNPKFLNVLFLFPPSVLFGRETLGRNSCCLVEKLYSLTAPFPAPWSAEPYISLPKTSNPILRN